MTPLAAWLYRWRIVLSAFFIAGAVALFPYATRTAVNNDLDAWFSRQDPLFRDYDRFRAEFGGTQPLIVALQSAPAAAGAPDAGLFTQERLVALQEIAAAIERIPGVQRVQSLADATILRAQGARRADDQSPDESIALGPLLDLSQRTPEEIRRLAVADPLFRDELISRDGRVAALVVTFDEARLDRARAEILDTIYAAVASRLPRGVSAYYNGSIEINENYNRVTVANQRRFVPPILLLTLIAVYALFRSPARAAIALLSIGVSVAWTLGLYALLGFGFNILTAMLTPLVVVLAISDDVHLIQHYDGERRAGSVRDAFVATVSYQFVPLLAASGTTALGLLSLATSDIVAVRHFGIGAAAGVMIDFLASIVLVPTLLSCLPPARRTTPHDRYLAAPLRLAAGWATARAGVVIAGATAVMLVAGAGIARLRVDTNHIAFFSPAHPLSRSAAVIDTQLTGVYSFHVLLEGPPDSMKAPDIIRRIERLEGQIARLPQVRKTTSMAGHIRRTNQELHGGDAAAATIPDDAGAVAQEILLFTLTDKGRREMERVVSSDFSTAQIVVRLPSMGSDLVFDAIEASQALATHQFAGTSVTATVTGSGRLFASLDHDLVRSQISSFTTAFLTIFATMFLIFRSARFGVLALVPNLFPVIVVLGVMGWSGLSLNVATVMVASVALGIVDDDTIHFLHRFRHDVATGVPLETAAQGAAAIEGRAALTTALINGCGFAVLTLSEYRPSAWFGGLLALTLGVAFVAELLVLPAAIKVLARFLQRDLRGKAAADGAPATNG